jgi:hypothetical protein
MLQASLQRFHLHIEMMYGMDEHLLTNLLGTLSFA